MSRPSRLKVLTTLLETGVIPIFYHPDPDVVTRVALASVEGGARCFEFTNRGDRAHEVFRAVAERLAGEERIILGAGSILDAGTAALYIQLGAAFIVGPALNPDVVRVCNRRKVACIPGCGSVSEISQAEELGVEICKVFPGSAVGGPAFIKDVLGPMPWARLMPTGGVDVTEASVSAWMQAGAACVGVGGKLFSPEVIASGDFSSVAARMNDLIGWVQAARCGKPVIA